MKFSSAGILEQSMHSHPFFCKLNSVIYKKFQINIKYAFKLVILLHVLIKKLFPHCKLPNSSVPREDRCFQNQTEVMPGIHKSLKIRAQAISPFTHTYVLRRTLVAKAEMYKGRERAAWVGPPPSMYYPLLPSSMCKTLAWRIIQLPDSVFSPFTEMLIK
jgi:hypothetical protein